MSYLSEEPRWWLITLCGLLLVMLGTPGTIILGIAVFLIGAIKSADQWDKKNDCKV